MRVTAETLNDVDCEDADSAVRPSEKKMVRRKDYTNLNSALSPSGHQYAEAVSQEHVPISDRPRQNDAVG